MTAPFDSNGLVADHKWARAVMYIDEKTVRLFFRFEQCAHGTPQGLIVTSHHQHCDGFSIIQSGSDNQMSQDPRQRWPRSADSSTSETISQRKGDAIGAGAVHRAFLDRNNPMRSPLVMAHDQSSSTRT